jgi:tetratricopeptide (TPR) repeat protein
MSYITTALKRAHKAKDDRYLPYGDIISARPRRRVRGRKRLILGVSLALLVFLASTAFSLIIYFGHEGAMNEEGALYVTAVSHRARIEPAARHKAVQFTTDPARDADILFQAGLRRQQAEDLTAAEAFYRRAIESNPKNLDALNNLGVLFLSQRRDTEAIDIFNKLMEVKGDWADPYYNLACLYSRQGDIPNSMWYLKVALRMNRELREWARNDPDLEPLRSNPEYRKIIN